MRVPAHSPKSSRALPVSDPRCSQIVRIVHLGRGISEEPMTWGQAQALCAKLDDIRSPYRIDIVCDRERGPQ